MSVVGRIRLSDVMVAGRLANLSAGGTGSNQYGRNSANVRNSSMQDQAASAMNVHKDHADERIRALASQKFP
jgi:hypothetical protein